MKAVAESALPRLSRRRLSNIGPEIGGRAAHRLETEQRTSWPAIDPLPKHLREPESLSLKAEKAAILRALA